MEMNDWISNRSSEEIELELKVEFFETKGDWCRQLDIIFNVYIDNEIDDND